MQKINNNNNNNDSVSRGKKKISNTVRTGARAVWCARERVMANTRRASEWTDAQEDTDPAGRAPRSFCIFTGGGRPGAGAVFTDSTATPPPQNRRDLWRFSGVITTIRKTGFGRNTVSRQ